MRLFVFVLLTTLLTACTNSSTVPAGIIPRQKMETILWQLIQSDEYVTRQLAKDSLKKASSERMKIYQQVFDLNGTSLTEFKKSYGFYMSHPDITKVLFDSISARASRQRADMYKVKPGPQALKTDSLKARLNKVKAKPDTVKSNPALVNLKPVLPKIKTGRPNLKKDSLGAKPGKSKTKRHKRKTLPASKNE